MINILEERDMRFKKFTALALAVVTAASVAMTGCGSRIDEDAVVATLGDKEISLGLANFMAQYTAVSYDSYITMGYAKEICGHRIYPETVRLCRIM